MTDTVSLERNSRRVFSPFCDSIISRLFHFAATTDSQDVAEGCASRPPLSDAEIAQLRREVTSVKREDAYKLGAALLVCARQVGEACPYQAKLLETAMELVGANYDTRGIKDVTLADAARLAAEIAPDLSQISFAQPASTEEKRASWWRRS